ncbi:MAG: SprT family zinc-dependent metalloprotease [Bacteroidetes bacterium]|nr:SprT family zinc-dependent metalloprotease [Bacteroidota bacterium]
MPEVQYGDRTIQYSIQERNGLKSHYIVVEKNHGVILKGAPISGEQADKYVLKKARWILDKLNLVESVKEGDIVTGSRILYLGKKYYTEVYFNDSIEATKIEFNHSRFRITTSGKNTQVDIHKALDEFFRGKAAEKITPRMEKWSEKTGLKYGLLHFRKQTKRWGSCTPRNNIVINTEAIKLPFSLIDYLIVHELCHVKYKDHSKAFWVEVGKYLRNRKELDGRMKGMKM